MELIYENEQFQSRRMGEEQHESPKSMDAAGLGTEEIATLQAVLEFRQPDYKAYVPSSRSDCQP